MNKSCRTCAHHCAIKNSANVVCTTHNVIISAENDLDCPDYFQDNPELSPQDIYDRMTLFCGSHDNCSGCPYQQLHNKTLCVINFTIDSIK